MCLIPVGARAAQPETIHVQGRLADASGIPLPAGTRVFWFQLFDGEAGGNQVWPLGPPELQNITSDANGQWSAALGHPRSVNQ